MGTLSIPVIKALIGQIRLENYQTKDRSYQIQSDVIDMNHFSI